MTRWTHVCTLAVFAIGLMPAPHVGAQQSAPPQAASEAPSAASVPPVEVLFADSSAKEAAVRKALADPGRQPTVLKAVRTVVADYERVVRHYPTSSYCDDALWRAGRLARDAFDLFHDAHDRTTALRLFQQLMSQYPASRLGRLAPEQITWLNAHAGGSRTTVPAAPTPAEFRPGAVARAPVATAPPAAPPPAAARQVAPVRATTDSTPARLVTVRAVRRTVLPDVVRVVIEMDGEAVFHDERIDNPSRVFVDLTSTRTAPELGDRTLRFDGDREAVRQIRIGRQPNGMTRVVLDATDVSSYSVYPLYSPFRLVIDCLRTPVVKPPAPVAAVPRPPAAIAAVPRPPTAAPVPTAPRGLPVAAAPPPLRGRTLTPGPAPLPALLASRIEPVLPVPPLVWKSAHWSMPLPAGAAPMIGIPPIDTAAKGQATAAPPAASSESKPPLPAAAIAAAAVPGKPDPHALSMARQLGLGVSRIVIDPGHGGHDPGAQAEGTSEADLVLDVALRLEKLLKKASGVEVVLTRRENEFVSLQERTAIANRENADLFLSIHANANSVPSARGIETYFLNFATNQTAAAVAARENQTSEQTMGALQDVVKAIALNNKLDESRDFAAYVQREMIESLRPSDKTVKDLGVKQAPFVVLIGASMPSVLAEISFLTNPQDAKLLKTPAYRQKIAQALFEAVRKYQQSLKQPSSIAQQH